MVEDFDPDALFIVGWADRDYLKVARKFRKQGGVVIAGSDAQKNKSLNQKVLTWISPWFLKSAIDILWVAGERQRMLAVELGFRGMNCWSGYYACDWDKFAGIYSSRNGSSPRAFLYVGRFIDVKGIDILLEAYSRYRKRANDPWPLICAGSGKLAPMLVGREGVINKGFVQPDQLAALFGKASAFILPSRREPWGVVVQEAAATGLPLVCSDVCGAAVHLLKDSYNGYLFENENVSHLAECLVNMSSRTDAELQSMSTRSFELSKQYTPERWASTLVNGLKNYQDSVMK